MKKDKTGYIIPHTHWDREWRYPVWKNRILLIEFMEKLLNILDTDEEYKCFLMDGQVAPIEDYLEVCPDQEDKVRKYIKEGRIAVGPWFTLPDLYPLNGECLVRNLLKGTRISKKYGEPLKVGYNSFGWGQTAQFPQIYDGFGIDFIICAKKVSNERAPQSEFIWEAPDGTRILTSRLGEHARANFYFHTYLRAKYGINCLSSDFKYKPELSGLAVHNADSTHADEDFFVILPKEDFDKTHLELGMKDAWDATDATAAINHRLFLNGTDFSTPHPEQSKMIHDLNEISGDTEYISCRLEEYAEKLHEVLDKDSLRVIKGELRDGPSCDCSGNALASRIYLKQLNKKAQNLLIHKAEPLLVFSHMMGGDDLKGYMDRAWQYLLKAHPHDSINGVTQDKTANDVEYRLEQVCEMAQAACDKAAGWIIKQIDLSGYDKEDQLLVVFNFHAFPVSEVLKVCISSAQEQKIWDFKAFDSDGKELMIQDIFRDEKTYPVHDLEARPWPFATDRHLLYLETGEIPAYGYKVVRFEKKSEFDRTHFYWMPMRKSLGLNICHTDNILENEYLKVNINQNGTLKLLDKKNGREYDGLHYFEDTGDVGNYWAYYPPYHNQTYNTLGGNAQIWCEDNGPLSATIGIRYLIQLPVCGYESKCGVYGEGKRSDETTAFSIISYVTLKKGAKRLDIKTTLLNNVKNHRLRVAFPTGIKAKTVDTAGHFTVDRRPAVPVKENDGTFYPEMQTLPMQNFVDVNNGTKGLALLNNCLTEYEMADDEHKTIYLTLFRAMGNMIVTWWEAVGEFPDQEGSQLQRKMEYEYAIYPHEGDWSVGDVYSQAEEFNIPPSVYQICGNQMGFLPQSQGFLNIEGGKLEVSCLKKSEDRESYILRIYNPQEEKVTTSVSIGNGQIKPVEIWKCSLNEEREEKLLIHEGHKFTIEAASNKIITYEIKI